MGSCGRSSKLRAVVLTAHPARGRLLTLHLHVDSRFGKIEAAKTGWESRVVTPRTDWV
jgi:hypothetical protein